MPLSSRVKVELTATQTTALDLASVNFAPRVTYDQSFADGGGANQADKLFTDERTLGDGATEDLDLDGVLADAFGNTITFAGIKGILIISAAANTTNLTIGGAATNAFVNWVGDATDTIILKPGGVFLLTDPSAGGYAVTAGTGDLLTITNGAGATATYKIVLLGD